MKTDDLIQKLSADLKPVKPMLSPVLMLILFVFIGCVFIGLSFIMMSARESLFEQLVNSRIQMELAMSFLLAVSALALSVFLARPGTRDISRKLEKVTIAFFILVLFHGGFRVAQLSRNQIYFGLNVSGVECFLAVFGFAVMFGASLMYWLRQGATASPVLSGLVVGTACVAFGNVSITFFCGIDNGMHILVWHFVLPLVAALGCGFAASRFLLKW